MYKNITPVWIKAKFKSTCNCGKPICKGDQILYYHHLKKASCVSCSEQHQRDMDAAAFDESVYNY